MVTAGTIQEYLPKYLTPAQQGDLLAQLTDFENRNYYTTLHGADILQGDGWNRLVVLDFNSGKRDNIKGILLSNSCDVAPENKSDRPLRLVFAPLVQLTAFKKLIERSGLLNAEQISNKIEAIKKQRVTSLFYLPRGGALDDDYIALLDDLHNMPLQAFLEQPGRAKLFTLGQMGFYLFLLKLSIHFCRFNEEITRDPQTV